MVCVRYCHYCIWSLILTYALIPNIKCNTETNPRFKRNIVQDNFNVLLNLYKMNPLKDSKVFKMFTNKILLPNRADRRASLHFDVNESGEKQIRDTMSLKDIEDVIKNVRPIDRNPQADFNLNFDDTVLEKFDEVKSNKLVKNNPGTKDETTVKDETSINIFGPIYESKGNVNIIPITKIPTEVTYKDTFFSMEDNTDRSIFEREGKGVESVIVMR